MPVKYVCHRPAFSASAEISFYSYGGVNTPALESGMLVARFVVRQDAKPAKPYNKRSPPPASPPLTLPATFYYNLVHELSL